MAQSVPGQGVGRRTRRRRARSRLAVTSCRSRPARGRAGGHVGEHGLPTRAVHGGRHARDSRRSAWDAALHASLGPTRAEAAMGHSRPLVAGMARRRLRRLGARLAPRKDVALAAHLGDVNRQPPRFQSQSELRGAPWPSCGSGKRLRTYPTPSSVPPARALRASPSADICEWSPQRRRPRAWRRRKVAPRARPQGWRQPQRAPSWPPWPKFGAIFSEQQRMGSIWQPAPPSW